MILFRGYPGIGKTTLALELCRSLRWPLLSKDDVKDPLVESGLIECNDATYPVLKRLLETQLQCGLSCVIETPLGRRDLYDMFCETAPTFNARVILLDCVLGETEWKVRLLERAKHQPPDCQKPKDPDKVLEHYGKGIKFACDPSEYFQVVMDRPPSELCRDCIAKIQQE